MRKVHPPRPGRPVDHAARAARRQQIMGGARACFRQHGFHAASTADIAALAGVSVANLYQYFASKDDLVVAIAEEDLSADLSLLASLNAAGSIGAAMAIAVDALTKEASDPAVSRLRLEVATEATRNPAVAAVFQKGERLQRQALAKLIKQGQMQGDVRADLDPKTGAFTVLCLVDGAFSRVASGVLPPQAAAKEVMAAIQAFLKP